MVWQQRMKDGPMSVAHESGLTSLVPCTDRQADLNGSTTCASDVQTHGNPRQSPRRGERGVLYAERAGCTRGVAEERGEDVRGTLVRLAKAAAGVHGTYVRHAVTAQEARGGARTTLGSLRACRHARRARYGASGRDEGVAGLTRDSRFRRAAARKRARRAGYRPRTHLVWYRWKALETRYTAARCERQCGQCGVLDSRPKKNHGY